MPVRKGRTTWIRVGADTLAALPGTLGIARAPGATVVDGGSGGDDPTPGGPGGGLPRRATARPPSARGSPGRA